MKHFDLDAYLAARPSAGPGMADINDTLEQMRKLRANGLAKGGYSLVEPYGRGRRMPREKKQGPRLKRTLSA